MPGLRTERQAIERATSAIHWLLTEGKLGVAHPGVKGHATACATQLIACRELLGPEPREEP